MKQKKWQLVKKKKLTFTELAVHLATQSVEHVGRLGHVDNLHVAVLVLAVKLLRRGEDARILVAELQVALQTTGGVLGALAVVSVGEGHDEAVTLHPLGLARGDELVNDAPRVVGEVTELGLPHDKSVGRRQRVTVLEAESTKLTQRGVGDNELALVLANVLQGSVGLLVLLVVENGVALGEGTTLDILTGDTDVVALGDERTESKSLGGGVINVLTLAHRLGTVGQDTLQVAVDVEAFGGGADNLTDMLESLLVDSGGEMGEDLSSQLLGGLEAVPGRRGPLLGRGLVVLGLGEALLEHAPHPLLVLLDVLLGEGAVLEQLLDVDVNLGDLLLDALVHEGLSERRLVSLVVAVLSVADKVNNNVVLELGAPVSGQLAHVVDSLNIVGVDVEDGGVDGLGNIGTVGGGTSETGVGGETNLVVDDEVDRAASGEGGQRVETKTLVDDTLGSKCSVTVQEHAHGGAVGLLIVVVVLDGAGLAQDDGVLGLQMRRVGDERQLDALSRRRGTLEVHTQMVLDITRTLVLGTGSTGELAEDGLVGLANDVAENVETSTMGHTDNDILNTVVDTAVDERLHTGNQGLATLETESLIVRVLSGEEGLEAGTPDETVQDTTLLVDRVLERGGDLEALAQPVALLTIGDVDELDTP